MVSSRQTIIMNHLMAAGRRRALVDATTAGPDQVAVRSGGFLHHFARLCA